MRSGLGAGLMDIEMKHGCTRCGKQGKVDSLVAYCMDYIFCGMTLCAVNLCAGCARGVVEFPECSHEPKYANVCSQDIGDLSQNMCLGCWYRFTELVH